MSLPEPVARVSRYLAQAGAEARIEEFSSGTPTAQEAAHAIGCELDQIVKSLVYVCDERAVLALVPGSRRGDARKVARAAGAELARLASPAVVHEVTGFDVGGVAPFALLRVERVLADRTLLRFKELWTGAGSDRHMAVIAPSELVRLTEAAVADLCDDARRPL